MKKQVVIIASLLAASHGAAFASSNDTAAAPFSSVETQQLFEQDAQPMQVAALSQQELRDTEGAFGPWGAAGGALVGGIGNIGYQLGAGRGWSWGSFGYAVGGGALTGFSGGAAAWYVVPRVAFYGGITAGRLGW